MSRNKQYEIGIDVGGTKIATVLLHNQKVIESSILATPKDSLEHFLIMVKAALDPLFVRLQLAKGVLGGIGIGIPGIIDHEKEEIVIVPNLPFLNKVKLIPALRDLLKNPELIIKLDNDANCFTRAEALIGAGRKSTNIYGMTIGTGIGGGWFYKGEIYTGHQGGANEPEHMIVDFDELITLGTAYQRLTQHNPALLAEEAYRGDLLAEKTYQELGSYLGIALSTIVNILDPEIIILGGSVVNSGSLFLDATKENLRKFTFSPNSRSIRLVKAKLGPLAGAIGAGFLINR
ncbi:MAG TPA: ROK family protein [bacterium]|nr:ROK family protein [bacterium]